MLTVTPVSIEQAFAHRGVRISHVAAAPELCDRVSCTGLDIWGGDSRSNVYFRPQHGKDFMVVVFKTASDARKMATFERTRGIWDGDTRVRPARLLEVEFARRAASCRPHGCLEVRRPERAPPGPGFAVSETASAAMIT